MESILKKATLIFVSLVVSFSYIHNVALATHKPNHGANITICHGTSSTTNPYTQNSVDPDSADGDTGNDNGQGDHSTHTGPVATSETVAQALKTAGTQWGDIIPPHNNFPGLNWTAEGQAIYNNGCNYVTVTPTNNPTPTPTLVDISTNNPTPTPTDTSKTPTVTPGQGPSATPGPGPSATPGPEVLGAQVSRGGGQVLGASTLAPTGIVGDIIMNLVLIAGVFMVALAGTRYAKEKI